MSGRNTWQDFLTHGFSKSGHTVFHHLVSNTSLVFTTNLVPLFTEQNWTSGLPHSKGIKDLFLDKQFEKVCNICIICIAYSLKTPSNWNCYICIEPKIHCLSKKKLLFRFKSANCSAMIWGSLQLVRSRPRQVSRIPVCTEWPGYSINGFFLP